ncbi:MAG: LacI family DNA-binding transcriptional regulator [Termitinemataceae bacterium]
MNVTIKDIAKFAGVSVGTVSKVLNNNPSVKPALRLRVNAVIEKLNYRPSVIAQNFKKRGTRMIGLIVPRILSQFYIKYVNATERFLKKKNYYLLLGNTDEDAQSEIYYLRTFADMRVAGLVISTSFAKDDPRILQELKIYETLKIPIVNVSRRITGFSCDTVVLNYKGGAKIAIRLLLEKGHRRIAIICAPFYSSVGAEFHKGYMESLYDYRVPYDKDLVCFGERDLKLDYQNILSLLSPPRRDPPTEIVVASNFRLLLVLRALREKSLSIPRDISLISFGDEELLTFINPPITAINTFADQISDIANEMLFERIEGRAPQAPRIRVVDTQLVIRDSVRDLTANLTK